MGGKGIVGKGLIFCGLHQKFPFYNFSFMHMVLKASIDKQILAN